MNGSNPDMRQETLTVQVEESEAAQRLDKVLSARLEDISRARLQALIAEGQVSINGETAKSASRKVQFADRLEVTIPPLEKASPQAEDIALDVVYEDDDVLVLNKPAGLVVHPGAGNHDGTLVNALLHYCEDTLSGIGGVKRPGIVHRLDKDTSGLMIVAKHDKAHQGLAAQLQDRSLSRVYKALVLGVPMPRVGKIDQPIGRHANNRTKMTVTRRGGKEARTYYKVLESYGDALSLVECKLESGRTHQIRVHMAFLKYPLIGDPLYGPQSTALISKLKKAGLEDGDIEAVKVFPRQALHAAEISFLHPVTNERHHYKQDVPEDFSNLLKIMRKI